MIVAGAPWGSRDDPPDRKEREAMTEIMLRSPFVEMRRLMERIRAGDGRGRLLPRPVDISLVKEGALALDIEERDGAYTVTASVPGFTRDELKVQVNDGVLTISAQRSEEREEKERHYYRRERYAGSLIRRATIPGIGAQSEVDARLKDGVLTVEITVPKAPQAKQIEVNEG
jgi:HSP20 family protein